MKRPLYFLLCAIACTSMVSAAMPMAAIAEAIQPQPTAEQQAQADATNSDTGKAEDGTNTNATADTAKDSTAKSTVTSAANTESADATNAGTTAATTTPTPSLRAQANPTPAAIPTAAETTYAHSATAAQNGVTFTVSWSDAPAGTATTFHVTQANGSSQAKARMDVPTYWEGGSQESVCDPSRATWGSYYNLGTTGYDFTFNFTASGTYRIYFYFMDNDRNDPQNDKGIYYLRATAEVTVNDAARPSVTQIVTNAVAQCRQETNGSEYDMALWLHDWTLDQLEYDHSLNWCSAESGLTRHQGTCESYQRIYSKLLDAAGIANGRITGNGHTWNAVKIDGKWCQMDLTWDDTSDNWYGDLDQRHLYFGLTDELMAIAHSDHTANYQKDDYAYRSTDLSNNYFVRNCKADEWAEKYADRIQQHLDAKEESFSIDADNQSLPPSISGIQNGIVAYAMNQREWKTDGYKANLTATSKVEMTSNKSWTAKYMFKAKHDESVEPSQTNYSNTPEGYARMLYAECFNTPEPTTHQISYWTGVLKQEDGPQRTVKEFFTSSVIKQKNAVEITRLLYRVVAGINNPTEAQLAYWTQHIKANGVNGAIAEFSNSKFFISQCMNYGLCNKNSQGSQSPSVYAWLLYEKCLDTPAPGQWRIDYWANVLANNGGSKKAIKEFFTSSTFRAKKPEAQARLLYNIVAGVSNPTEFQIAYWTNVINSNGLICAIENFLNSDLFTKQKLAYNIL